MAKIERTAESENAGAILRLPKTLPGGWGMKLDFSTEDITKKYRTCQISSGFYLKVEE